MRREGTKAAKFPEMGKKGIHHGGTENTEEPEQRGKSKNTLPNPVLTSRATIVPRCGLECFGCKRVAQQKGFGRKAPHIPKPC
jgi:hypothetical protein